MGNWAGVACTHRRDQEEQAKYRLRNQAHSIGQTPRGAFLAAARLLSEIAHVRLVLEKGIEERFKKIIKEQQAYGIDAGNGIGQNIPGAESTAPVTHRTRREDKHDASEDSDICRNICMSLKERCMKPCPESHDPVLKKA